ncbi:MAG: TonB-dependent receptor [Acidobacteria bacterium]|nr:TonB-dependent receptor [Acidobacteriota bacterium]
MFRKTFALLSLFYVISDYPVGFAQATRATISGVVKDKTGAVLPGVSVTVKNMDTGIARTTLTDDQGRYRLSQLAVGNYEVQAELSGFQTGGRRGIVLTVGREAVVDFTLEIGEMSEKVMVTGEAPLIDTASAEIGGLVEQTQIGQLPLRARDYSQLITLQAGAVQLRHVQGSGISGFGNRIAVSGARTSANAFSLDGINLNTETGQLPSGVTGAALGVEAVREFQVLTSNYSAQHGRAAGANVVAITRSGTNDLHGLAYWYLRNDNLDARNFFDAAKPEFKRNQFGFNVGGPVVRDKTFFFGNYEGLGDRLGLTSIGRVPTSDARRGILPSRTVTVDPQIVPYLNLYPLPNGRIFDDGTGEFLHSDTVPTDQDYFTVRLDHTFTDKYSLFGRFSYDGSDRATPDDLGLFAPAVEAKTMSFALELKALFSSQLIGVFRAGVNRNRIGEFNQALISIPPSLSFVEKRPLGSIDVSGLSVLTGIGGSSNPRQHAFTAPQGYVSFDYTTGRHALKFGVDLEQNILAKRQDSRSGGEIRFGSLMAFLTNGVPTRFRVKGPDRLADPFSTFEQNVFAAYIQDDIHATPRLTLNLGLRYGFTTVPTERYGRLSNIRFATDPLPTVGEPYYENDVINFDPRVGFAWDVTGNSKTSLRGGFGIFQEPILVKHILNTISAQPPFWSEAAPLGSQLRGLFPFVSQAQLEELVKGPQTVHSFDFQADTPYMIHSSLSLQRALTGGIVATATYTFTRGVHLVSRTDFNLPVPTFLPDGRVFFALNAPPYNPSFGTYKRYGTGADSWYNGLQMGIRNRMSSGFMFQASYTYSRNLDTQSSHLADETTATRVMNPFNFFQDKALADTDVRHNFVGNWVYELPFGRDWTGAARGLLYGWTVSGIVSLATGSPRNLESNATITHVLMTNNLSRPDLVPGASNTPVLGGPDRYFDPNAFVPQQRGFFGTTGRNTLIAPGLAMVDLALTKKFSLTERHRLEFRTEFFNLLNRANFGYPEVRLFNASGARLGSAARITRTTTPARQIQFALRYTF